MSRSVTTQSIMDVFPYALQTDDEMTAVAEAIAQMLSQLYVENDLLIIYARIDDLPEALLDTIARDFKVDWYLYDAPIDAKRNQIKSLFDVHRHLGTKAAMERALSDVFGHATVEEWYEYGGSPYSFRIEVTIPEDGITIEQQKRALNNIRYFKNVRSRLEQTNYTRESAGKLITGGYTDMVNWIDVWPP